MRIGEVWRVRQTDIGTERTGERTGGVSAVARNSRSLSPATAQRPFARME
jgi:hypothetical protein